MRTREGQLLLAGPDMGDPHFAQTVILLMHHGGVEAISEEQHGDEQDELWWAESGDEPADEIEKWIMGDLGGVSDAGELEPGGSGGAGSPGGNAGGDGGGDGGGGWGVVLNRPTTLRVAEAWEELSEVWTPCNYRGRLYQGGPCPGPLMVLHTRPERADLKVTDEIYCTFGGEQVAWLLEHNDGPMRCVAGYAGWAEGQIEAELDQQAWIVTPATPGVVFGGVGEVGEMAESADKADAEEGADKVNEGDAGDGSRLWLKLLARINPGQAALLRNPGLMPSDPSMN